MMRAGRVLMVASLALTVQMAFAGTYVFQPDDRDLNDLDHNWAYEWGIATALGENEVVVGASLFFNDIRNWNDRPNDLYVTLLDSDFEGTRRYWDDEGDGDEFAGDGLLLNHWEDLPSSAQDITYNFDANELVQLNLNLADDQAGVGFDPDCHFYNRGIKLTLETDEQGGDDPSVPEPLAGSILLAGLGALAARRRRR